MATKARTARMIHLSAGVCVRLLAFVLAVPAFASWGPRLAVVGLQRVSDDVVDALQLNGWPPQNRATHPQQLTLMYKDETFLMLLTPAPASPLRLDIYVWSNQSAGRASLPLRLEKCSSEVRRYWPFGSTALERDQLHANCANTGYIAVEAQDAKALIAEKIHAPMISSSIVIDHFNKSQREQHQK